MLLSSLAAVIYSVQENYEFLRKRRWKLQESLEKVEL
jgi:hypothetical protein